MSEQMSETPEPGREEDFVGTPGAGDANPEEYRSSDQQAGVSQGTGTTYDQTGEAEATPHDDVVEDDEEEDL